MSLEFGAAKGVCFFQRRPVLIEQTVPFSSFMGQLLGTTEIKIRAESLPLIGLTW